MRSIRTTISFFGVLMSGLAGCSDFETGEGGMQYQIHSNKGGETIKEGEIAEVTLVEKTESDSVLWNSQDYDRPALLTREKSVFKGDLYAAIGMLSEGDSATIKISLDSMVEKMGRMAPKDPNEKYVIYSVKVNKVLSKGNLTDSLYKLNTEAFLQARLEDLKNKERVKLAGYLAAHKIKAVKSGSGLSYRINKTGTGASATPGDTVEVNYTGTFMSGKIFDTTYPDVSRKNKLPTPKDSPRPLTAGLNSTIPGLEEAILSFPAGSKVTVIIPSALAFGREGFEGIQPYTPLIYELEIVNIKRLKGKRPIETGAGLPTFAFTNIADNVIVQKDDIAKGKSVMVMYSTDCDHCQHEIQAIGASYESFKNVNLYLVAAEEVSEIELFMEKYGKALRGKKNVAFLWDNDRRATGAFQFRKYPSVYVYDEKHQLIKFFEGQTGIGEIIKVIR